MHEIDRIDGCTLIGQIEYNSGELYVHITDFDKTKWNRSFYEQMTERWVLIQSELRQRGHRTMKTAIKAGDVENKRFLNSFGFVTDSGVLELMDGRRIEIMRLDF